MKRYLPCVMLVLGIALVIIGVVTGQAGEVLAKAVRICMECVGLG